MASLKDEMIAVRGTCVGINSMNIILHIIGISLLVYMYRRGDNKPQQIYLINLSCAELIWSVCCFASDVIEELKLLDWTVDENLLHAVQFALYTGLMINITCAMSYITGDRCHNL